EERHKLLVNELNHRVKNTLAIVQSVAAQTIRTSEDNESLRRNFEGRLIALAKAHDVLTRESWKGAPLSEVVESAIAFYRGSGRARFAIGGSEVFISAKQTLAFALALHELSTNAVKYGALSTETGYVRISWTITSINGTSQLIFRWIETGGPPVMPP